MLSAEAVAWLGVVGFGVYHGLNPSMGWPLAVANGLAARRDTAVFATVLPLGVGHLLAMAVVLNGMDRADSMGNLQAAGSFDELWRSPRAVEVRRRVASCPKNCWMIGSASPVMKKYLRRTARWANPAGGYIHAMHQHEWGDMHWRITGRKADGSLDYEGGWQNNRFSFSINP